MKKTRIFLVIAAILLVIVGVEMVIAYFHDLPVHKSRLGWAREDAEVKIGGPFTLVDHTGRAVTDEDFRDRYMLIYFGYTFCPDVCPTALQAMMTAYAALPPEWQGRVVPLFITIDPERDTVGQMRSYVAAFHPALIGLSGTVEQTTAAARAYRTYFAKVKPEDDRPYLVDHSAIIYLMDPKGRYYAHFSHGTSAETLHDKLKGLPWPAD